MQTRKVTRDEWAYQIKRAIHTRNANKKRMRQDKYKYYEAYIGKYMPIPYLIGGAAAILLLRVYGWREFAKFLLSWIVSITIVATAAYHLWRYYESKI